MSFRVLFVWILFAFAGCLPPVKEPVEKIEDHFWAGAGAVDVTPVVEIFEDKNNNKQYDPGEPFEDLNANEKYDPVWLAGFNFGRQAIGIHDRLWARALCIRGRYNTIVIVCLDIIGLLNYRVRKIKEQISKKYKIPTQNIIIAATHNHSGPDTIGLWGKTPLISGVDWEYMQILERRTLDAVGLAFSNLKPVNISAYYFSIEGLVSDPRPPVKKNEIARALYFTSIKDNKIEAVFVNVACHPEALTSGNHYITSDYPYFLREYVEQRFKALCLFSVADIGGMQTPSRRSENFDSARVIGEEIAKKVVDGYHFSTLIQDTRIILYNSSVEFPLENARFIAGLKLGIFGKLPSEAITYRDGKYFVNSETTVIWIGGAITIAALPGEIFPELAQKIYSAMQTEYKILIGLADDEIGYIIPEEDFDLAKYEESMSLGRKTGTILLEKILWLIKNLPQ